MNNSIMNGAKNGAKKGVEAVTFFGILTLAYYGIKGTVNLTQKWVSKLMASHEESEESIQPEPPKKEEAAGKKEEVKPTEDKVEESSAG